MVKKEFNIVLADDDPDDTALFVEAINEYSQNINIHVVTNGEALLSYLYNPAKQFPDMVFLDLNMPAMDGFDTLKSIRSQLEHIKLTIVVFTTSNNYRDIEKAYGAGADFYIQKPNSYDDLFEVFKSQLLNSG